MSEDAVPPTPGLTDPLRDSLRDLVGWCRARPADALLLAAIAGVLTWFFCFYHVFTNGFETAARWMQLSWNSENDLEHGGFIMPAALLIVWWHRAALAAAPKSSSPLGLLVAIGGILLFVFSVRTLQPRLAIMSLPPIFYGGVRYVWGRETARIILFPCAFLVFMVPIGFLVSRTVGLQTMTAGVAAKLSTLIGIPVDADGAALRALDGSFQFEVAGGCSGIRSLTAMTMLAALYVHFTQRQLWKKALIFASSLLFAVLGNFMRIFSVVLFAKLINPKIAAGLYHDYSGFIFFPFAVSAMVAFSRLLNREWFVPPPPDLVLPSATPGSPAPKSRGPVSYDY